MAVEPVPDTPLDNEPDVVATPEGDNEFAPDQPLKDVSDGLQTPRGNAPSAYDGDHLEENADSPVKAHEMTTIEKVIDEISHGTLIP